MKIAVIRHGVGREAKKVLPFLENTIYKDIFKINNFEFEFFYLFREINNENSKRSNEKNLTSEFAPLPFEKIIKVVLPENFHVNFQAHFKKDVHGDNFKSFRNLLNQTYMFRKLEENIDINEYSSFIVLRDDVIFLQYGNFLNLLKDSQKGYVTSIWDWEGGVHDRFYMCPKNVFHRLTYKYEKLRNLNLEKKKVNPFLYCGEFLTLKVLKQHKFKIYPHNIKTQRVRKGFVMAKEKYRIRLHDAFELINIIESLLFSRFFPFCIRFIKKNF